MPSSSGEFDFIAWLRAQQPASALVPVPAGDDLAVLNWPVGELLLVGVDQVLDGVHFDAAVHSPRDIGRKAMNRNLSDCAAMACLPAAAVVTFALPRGVGVEYAKELYLGVKDAGDRFHCAIVGGDTGSWSEKLAVTVTILGRSAGVEPVSRSGARTGDLLYVSGLLGGSILGRHLSFEPRVELARQLTIDRASRAQVGAMIDLSDGLSRDLGHICRERGVGAIIDANDVPIHEDARTLAARTGQSPLDHALHDGEDYELLVAMRPTPEARDLTSRLGLTRIGQIVAEAGTWIEQDGQRVPLLPKAWEHRL